MTKLKIAVVGDIHEEWEVQDHLALYHLGVDLVLFVGDFGNEAVPVVRLIASLELPKAVIMGNHDAWYTASSWGRSQCPYNHTLEDRVQQQLDLLGDTHVGYGKLDFPQFNFSVVGSRPFSWGGADWKNKRFLRDRFGVSNFADSVERIVSNARDTASNTLIFLGHNAPFGLGSKPEDICGKDWFPLGGDFGDPDFAAAIAQVRELGKRIPLVTFGHMHHSLRHTRARLRTAVTTDRVGTIYLNSASVPRLVRRDGEKLRNFSLVSWESGSVTEISLLWVGEDFRVVSEKRFYCREELVAQTAP
jgi:uncharacterized protein (TIGR04168 family)